MDQYFFPFYAKDRAEGKITDAQATELLECMYEQLTGLSQEHIRGKNVRDLVQEGTFDCILNPEIVRTGRPTTHVFGVQQPQRTAVERRQNKPQPHAPQHDPEGEIPKIGGNAHVGHQQT